MNEIRDLDRKFFMIMRNSLLRLKGALMVLYDHMLKNMDRITDPRGEDRTAHYTS